MKLTALRKYDCCENELFIKSFRIMKLTLVLLLAACLQVGAKSYAQKITLQGKNIPLQIVFDEIGKQTGYNFLYTEEVLSLAKKIDINVKKASIEEVLEYSFRDQPLTYTINEGTIVVKRKESANTVPATPPPPPLRIKGVVTDENGKPLAGASVLIKNTKTGTTTNEKGEFQITTDVQKAVLQVSYVGMETREITVSTSETMTIVLKPAIIQQQDVVVVGYGRQKAVTVTGAISSVTGKDLVSTPVSNITNMLVGRSSGISAVQGSGEPGQNSATIRIRGIATLNGQDPLIVIDGIQQPAEQPYIVLNAMDANEIENVSVLKDASATAVYGIRGANGVIVITTRRGRINRPQFSFTVNSGISKATSLLRTVGSYEFALFRNEAVKGAQAFGNHTYDNLLFSDDELWKFKNNRDYTEAEVDAMSNLTAEQKAQLKNSPAIYYTSHNYYREQFGGTGNQQQYNLNISGGTEKVKYFTSLGYYHQQGILNNTNYYGSNTNPDFKRYNFRSNFDIDVIRNFQISVNLAGQTSVGAGPGYNTTATSLSTRYQAIAQSILENSPFCGPGIVDGHLITGYVGTAGTATNPLGAKGAQSGSGTTPLAALLTGGTLTQYITSLTSSLSLKHTMNYLTQGLSSHVTVAYDDSYTKNYSRRNSVPTYSIMRDPSDPNRIVYIGGQLSSASLYDNYNNSTWRKIYLEAGLDYRRAFAGRHNVSGLVLANAQKYTANGMSFNTPSGLMGLVGRATYDFREKYLAEFNLGINGTENFAENKRFGYFPAASVGWVLSKEPFFPANKILTWAKFRASYGEVGNDQLGSRRYLYLPNTWAYTGSGYYFGNSNGSSANSFYTGALETALGNKDVTWERARKLNIAADFKFFSNRLSLSGSLFWENRNNILVTLQTIPAVYGVASSNVPPANLGKVSNKGYEVESGWTDAIRKLNYFIKANLSFARNKIDYMAEAPYPYEWMNQTGYAIGQYKGLVTEGFYNTQEELANRPYNTYGNYAKLGDLKFKDINGDGIIDNKDIVPIGYANLPQIAYNITIGFNYRGFDVSALLIGTAKGSFPQSGYELANPFNKTYGSVQQYAYDGHWTAEKYANGEKITYPEFSFTGGGPNTQFSDFWVKSNSFQRLKNLEIGYSFLNKTMLEKAGIKSVRFYFNGNNLFTWGSHLVEGVDPELSDAGSSATSSNAAGYIYPITKTFNVGVNVQF